MLKQHLIGMEQLVLNAQKTQIAQEHNNVAQQPIPVVLKQHLIGMEQFVLNAQEIPIALERNNVKQLANMLELVVQLLHRCGTEQHVLPVHQMLIAKELTLFVVLVLVFLNAVSGNNSTQPQDNAHFVQMDTSTQQDKVLAQLVKLVNILTQHMKIA